jgi:hypothetical protein
MCYFELTLNILRMAYIEENLQKRKGSQAADAPSGPADPYAELHALTQRYQQTKPKSPQEEGSVAGSMSMLTAIPEVDLGMEYVRVSYLGS